MRRILTAVAAVLASMALVMGPAEAVTHHHHKHPRHHHAPRPSSAVPCRFEDGSGGRLPCYWDGGSFGNGVGLSYWIDRHDVTHYVNDKIDFRYQMTRKGWHRVKGSVRGHRLCFVIFRAWGEPVRCFDGYRPLAP